MTHSEYVLAWAIYLGQQSVLYLWVLPRVEVLALVLSADLVSDWRPFSVHACDQ